MNEKMDTNMYKKHCTLLNFSMLYIINNVITFIPF